MRENVIRLALAALAALALAACFAGGEMPSPGEQEPDVLIYANLNPDGADRRAIRQFNAAHEDIQIEVRDYCGDGTQGNRHGRDLLITEIMAGRVPDIIDLGVRWGTDGQLPYRQLAQKGYLENLWPFIENDPDLGRERILEAPLRAAEVNGGLYMVFDSVQVGTLVGAESVVGDRTSWSLEELREAFEAMPEGSTVLEYYFPKQDMVYYMLGMMLDDYIDWETGQCSFDSQSFRSALEFIDETCQTDFNWDTTSVEALNEEITRRRMGGLQMLSSELIAEPGCMQRLDAQFGGKASFIGYPVEDGSVGSCFRSDNRKLAMSSACRNKDAAWDFIRQILLPRYTADSELPFGIPINRADYALLKKGSAGSAGEYEVQLFYHGPAVKLPRISEEEYRRFEDFFNSIEKIDLCDDKVYNIVYELCGPYFTGDKTLDETVDLIQNRVQLYVNENR